MNHQHHDVLQGDKVACTDESHRGGYQLLVLLHLVDISKLVQEVIGRKLSFSMSNYTKDCMSSGRSGK